MHTFPPAALLGPSDPTHWSYPSHTSYYSHPAASTPSAPKNRKLFRQNPEDALYYTSRIRIPI